MAICTDFDLLGVKTDKNAWGGCCLAFRLGPKKPGDYNSACESSKHRIPRVKFSSRNATHEGDAGRKLGEGIRFSLTGVPLDVSKMITVDTIHM